MKSLTYVEIDVDYCALSCGVGACTATPAGGQAKCYNTLATCQSRADFTNAPVTLRFAVDCDYLPKAIECLPAIRAVNFTPATISLGQDLGERATLSVDFGDFRHSDTGAGHDKYYAERSYNAYDQGTFWGRFRARQPYLRGRAMRLIRGVLGQTLEDMTTWHYVIESSDGPARDGTYTIVAKDILKIADSDRAMAPRPSNGYLSAAISEASNSATLLPSGVGEEYPASGYVAIGGAEICAFTRAGDTLTLTRGQLGTAASTHSAQDRAQLVLRYEALGPADIVYDLLLNYAGLAADYLPVASWRTEVDAYLQTVYTATIAEPTGVRDLLSELIQQAALALWWDAIGRIVRLQVLRRIPTDAAVFGPDNILGGTTEISEQPEKRLSQVMTYFAQNNPLGSLDDASNYRSAALTVEAQAESDYGSAVVKTIYSRWIPVGGRATALKLNTLLLGRFRDPPRAVAFDVWRYGDVIPVLGGGYQFEAWQVQDASGATNHLPIQIMRLNPGLDRYRVEAEEMLWTDIDGGVPTDPDEHVIIIDVSMRDVNVRTLHDTLYPEPTATTRVTVVIEAGVTVAASSRAVPALDVGTWPSGCTVTVVVRGSIRGAGGYGGRAGYGGHGLPGSSGGVAIYTRHAITLDAEGGNVFGGGGGGGGGGWAASGGGGGGAGDVVGLGGDGWNDGAPGGQTVGGLGGEARDCTPPEYAGDGGRGGDAGEPGQPGGEGYDGSFTWSGGDGGPAGASIDGASFTTITKAGDIRGPQIN